MKTIAIKLPDDLLAKIQDLANKRNETRSAVMRETLEEFFSRNNEEKPYSCLDHALDLAGCIQGPPDLSTNQSYMDDYGK